MTSVAKVDYRGVAAPKNKCERGQGSPDWPIIKLSTFNPCCKNKKSRFKNNLIYFKSSTQIRTPKLQ